MKIAFLIMVHNNPTMLNCFIKQLLQYQGSVVFIHVDEKGLNIIPDIIEDPRVIIIPEHYNGSWGDYSQIQMVNALIKNAVNSGDFDYYSLHSGVDLCVSSRISAAEGIKSYIWQIVFSRDNKGKKDS